MKLKKYIYQEFRCQGKVRKKRCQYILEPKYKNDNTGKQCKLQVIIGDKCFRHYGLKVKKR